MPASFVIALEGPSYSGKSTLGASLARSLPAACLLPCYVDVAGGDAHVPPSRGDTPEAQLDGLRAFVELDRRRSAEAAARTAEAPWIVADRCWLSLLAHDYAVAHTGGPDVYDAAHALIAGSAGLLQPSLVMYLAVSEPRRRERVPAETGPRDADPAFNAVLDRFYAEVAPTLLDVPLRVLDGDAEPAVVHAQAAAIVLEHAPEPAAGAR